MWSPVLFVSVLGEHLYIMSCVTILFSCLSSYSLWRKFSFFKRGPKWCLSKSLLSRPVFSNRFVLDHFSHYSHFSQVFISGTKSECRHLLQTILQNRRLCTLLSPYFTPVASPSEFVTLYEKVVAFLSEDNSDVVFMLLTKVEF